MDTTPFEQATILLVDDTPSNLSVLLDYLPHQGFKVLVATSGERALEQVKYANPDLILLDVVMPGLDGLETCSRLKSDPDTRDIPVIFMTALSDTADKIHGFEAGAVDYITKPFQLEEVLARVTTHLTLRQLQSTLQEANLHLEQRVAERTAELEHALSEVRELKNRLKAENEYLKGELSANDDIIGESPALKRVLQQVEQVAPVETTVLVLGETGTGKELIARALHRLSPRREQPLIKVNCGALPTSLIESELFGHEQGAFTGATKKREGRFKLADGGTLFLDEMGDLPVESQVKLLRVLQEGEFSPVGSSHTERVDVRVIAATNRDLFAATQDGSFREDLYYRLAVFPLHVPPLRDRKEDIPLLAEFFVKKYMQRAGRQCKPLTNEQMNRLSRYHWPGNLRELQNVTERAVITARDGCLNLNRALPESLTEESVGGDAEDNPPILTEKEWQELERNNLIQALEASGWQVGGKKGAAQLLGMNASTLNSRLKTLGIKRPG